jgi:hypothetical protein
MDLSIDMGFSPILHEVSRLLTKLDKRSIEPHVCK